MRLVGGTGKGAPTLSITTPFAGCSGWRKWRGHALGVHNPNCRWSRVTVPTLVSYMADAHIPHPPVVERDVPLQRRRRDPGTIPTPAGQGRGLFEFRPVRRHSGLLAPFEQILPLACGGVGDTQGRPPPKVTVHLVDLNLSEKCKPKCLLPTPFLHARAQLHGNCPRHK